MNNTQPTSDAEKAPAPDDAQIKALAARITQPIVLVGMMGVGKSTIGRKLAQLLDFPFVDADDEIVQAAQMSIADIFDQFGEDYFRDGERRVIQRLLEKGKCVIATGGGAFVQADTQAMICSKGLSVWLDSDVDTLVERVSRNTKRPLLRGGDTRTIITRMKAEREPAYAKARFHVISQTGPHGDTVNRILEALEKCQ